MSKADGEVLEFSVPECRHRDLVISLRNREYPDRGPWGEDVVCRVTANYEVPASVAAFVGAFINGKVVELAPGHTLPHIRSGRMIVHGDGTIVEGEEPRVQSLPLAVQDLLRTAHVDMYGAAERFLHLMRWQQGASFTADIIEHFSLSWNVGGSAFYAIPLYDSPPITSGMRKGMRWESHDRVRFESLWLTEGRFEPAPHRLYHLADSLRKDAPEAAALVLAAALESAAKQHVKHFDPTMPWIVDPNAWSPSFTKLIQNVIPRLYDDKKVTNRSVCMIKPWLDDIDEFVRHRHSVAHDTAAVDLSYGVEHYFSRALDFMYLLNVVEGHEWAKRMLSHEICRHLDWPPPPPGFGSLQVQLT